MKEWNYAQMAHEAKSYGGPNAFVDKIYRAGVQQGKVKMVPWIICMAIISPIVWEGVNWLWEKIQYLQDQDEILQDREELIQKLLKANAEHSKLNRDIVEDEEEKTMNFTYELIYPDGTTEMAEETFETERDAEDAALYDCSCFNEGQDIMSLMGDMDEEIIEGECEYRIIEIDS